MWFLWTVKKKKNSWPSSGAVFMVIMTIIITDAPVLRYSFEFWRRHNYHRVGGETHFTWMLFADKSVRKEDCYWCALEADIRFLFLSQLRNWNRTWVRVPVVKRISQQDKRAGPWCLEVSWSALASAQRKELGNKFPFGWLVSCMSLAIKQAHVYV